MVRAGPYLFKFADSPAEFDAVHRLNHWAFVREIAQHPDPGGGRLVDKFDAKNRYLVAVRGGGVVGMLAAHDRPPFSVAGRLPDPAVLSAPGLRPVEIRLLAIVPEERGTPALAGLVWALYRYAAGEGYTHFVISGVVGQARLYARLGFEPLGPPVGTGRATFVPMWLPLPAVERTMGAAMRRWERRIGRGERVRG
jgi:N-acyl-L-homoserine lactone synthetase